MSTIDGGMICPRVPGLRQLFTLPLNKHKKTRVISIILILSAVINITGNFILVPQYGKMGASVATLFSQLFALVWFVYAVKKIESISFSLTRHLFMMLFWAGICYAGMQFFYLPLLTGWLVKSLFLILFVAVLFAFGLIQKDIITVVQKMMKGKAS
jgi:O-antigen/teichoic acid export membrane protein